MESMMFRIQPNSTGLVFELGFGFGFGFRFTSVASLGLRCGSGLSFSFGDYSVDTSVKDVSRI